MHIRIRIEIVKVETSLIGLMFIDRHHVTETQTVGV